MARPLVEPVTLQGDVVVLEPLSLDHVGAMVEAAQGDRASFALTMVPEPTVASVTQYIESALGAQRSGTVLPFATIRRRDGAVVGSSRFLNIEHWTWPFGRPMDPAFEARTTPEAAEIGGTWLHTSVQRTAVNSEAKLLMLTHAFETWNVFRLFFKTDERNDRSRRNIERSGASFEGVLRNHMYAADAGIRHSAYYSIDSSSWPSIKQTLVDRIASYASYPDGATEPTTKS